jgi:hypothetical protein
MAGKAMSGGRILFYQNKMLLNIIAKEIQVSHTENSY